LDEVDFEKRSWIPGSGWPFPKSALHPYYQRALELEGVDGATADDGALWKEIGLTSPNIGPEVIPYFSRWCPEPNFARLHHNALDKSKNLAVYLHANACRMILGSNGETVCGIRCRTLDGTEAVFRAERYVLCLGGIESSRFLLHTPEIEGGASLPQWNGSGMVGRHYQDHIDCNCAEILEPDWKRFHQYFDNVFSRGYKYHPKLKIEPSLAQQHRILNIAATMAFRSDTDEIQARIKQVAKEIFRGRIRELKAADLVYLGTNLPTLAQQVFRYQMQRRAFNPRSARIFLRVHCEQEPLSESSIALTENRDALGLFRAKLNWRVSSEEIRTIQTFAEMIRDTFARARLARVEIDPDLYSEDGRFLSKLDDSNHHMGGTRMSVSPADGVVDPDLRLHTTRNCYVCSSSVFPTSGFSNPTHTLLALAVRLAEHLASLPSKHDAMIETTTQGKA
jgi:choline dehydrogenase-like flavoprotein